MQHLWQDEMCQTVKARDCLTTGLQEKLFCLGGLFSEAGTWCRQLKAEKSSSQLCF